MTEQNTREDPYLRAFRGSFTATLRWPQFDALWARLAERADAGWFLYAVGEPPPTAPTDAAGVLTFLTEIAHVLRHEHREDYCGIVYADDLSVPSFVKIYDPHHLGGACGSSTSPPLPGWIMSLIAPVDLPSTRPPPQQRRRWWQRLVG
ncbi:hypothetical protein CKO25_08455 [Thiocapsa imhoffii]|uniref:Uncharacterized protein n=1 Tax=Thiocapsa imhoffii TaxID=382777 RepID=A0A9X0WHM4_9GAMM|nr:hypothetical protein [Thiocapsa imhoffii]MBK1644680.1 hypothetical protein [Thiocapsa imhoffii]